MFMRFLDLGRGLRVFVGSPLRPSLRRSISTLTGLGSGFRGLLGGSGDLVTSYFGDLKVPSQLVSLLGHL